jgi:hypothetical protein
MTTLEAVNRILAQIGFPPAKALDTGKASLEADAERHLDRVDERIQKIGWYWNIYKDISIALDGDSKLPVPAGTIYHIDSYGRDKYIDVIAQGSFLYDLDENTATFAAAMRVKYTKKSIWTDVPIAFQEWIVAQAAIEMVRTYARNWNREDRRELLRELFLDLHRDKLTALQEEGDQSDFNTLNTEEIRRIKGNRRQFYGSNIY